jgi:hypothetical protein
MDWEKILTEKPYEALNEEEKQIIGAEIDALEYTRMRQVWQETRQYFRATDADLPEPDPAIRKAVRTHMRQLPEKGLRGRIRSFTSFRIPAYQAVAAAVVLLGLIHFGNSGISLGNRGYGHATTVIADTTQQDSSTQTGFNLYEDSVFAKFMIESL